MLPFEPVVWAVENRYAPQALYCPVEPPAEGFDSDCDPGQVGRNGLRQLCSNRAQGGGACCPDS